MDIEKVQHVPRSTLIQVILSLVVNFSTLAPSMSLGFSAIVLPVLLSKDNPYRITEDEASWIASVASVATPIGCLLSGPIADKYGRKPTFHCINLVSFLGWIVITIAYHIPQYQYMIIIFGRLLTGLSTGLASMPAAVYMAEVSSAELRGMFTTWNSISFSIGVFLIYVLGWILKENWGAVAALTAGFPVLGTILTIIYVSESPAWLVSKNRLDDAKASTIKIFGAKSNNLTVQNELESLMKSVSSNKTEEEVSFLSNLKFLFGRSCIIPFILILSFFFFQQFSGIVVLVFYAFDVIKQAKITIDAYFIISLMAITRVGASVVVGFLSKIYGRRPLSMISGTGMAFSMIFLSLFLMATNNVPMDERSSMDWVPIGLLLIYFFISTIGFVTMPFAMAAEVFPGQVRGVASGLVTCLSYVFTFATVKVYPTMIKNMGNSYVFLFYGLFSLAGTIFVVAFLPETKNKTLQEIEEYFSRKPKTAKYTNNKNVIIEKVSVL